MLNRHARWRGSIVRKRYKESDSLSHHNQRKRERNRNWLRGLSYTSNVQITSEQEGRLRRSWGYFSGEEVLKLRVCWIDTDLGARSTVGVSLVEVFKHDMCGKLTLQEKHGTMCMCGVPYYLLQIG